MHIRRFLLPLAALLLPAVAHASTTIDFEAQGQNAPRAFEFGAGESITIDGATFSGGTLLNNEFSSNDVSAVYATAPYGPTFSNPISISFANSVADVSLRLVNLLAGTYQVTTNTGLSQLFTLDALADQLVSFTGTGITGLDVTALNTLPNQGPAYTFAIDDVKFSAGAVPEPATWAMMIGGLGLTGGAMRRRRARVSTVCA